MTVRDHKDAILDFDSFYDNPIEAKGWRNVLFDKSGKSYADTPVFRSEQEALAAAKAEESMFPHWDYIGNSGWNSGNKLWIIPVSSYSHTIQLPIL